MDGDVLRPWQIRQLERGKGCAQCGKNPTRITPGGKFHPRGNPCCERKKCWKELRYIEIAVGKDYLRKAYFNQYWKEGS